MPVEWLDYDSASVEWNDLVRYPTRAIGAPEWTNLPDLTQPDQDERALRWLRKLQSLSPPSRRCPRLFIAHLAGDRLAALKMARIASECGFHFWLDVVEPEVARFAPLSPALQPMITSSAVIEMAMLNCTHVIAVGAANSSPWVDYAFGRIRTRAAYLWQLGRWSPEQPGSTRSTGVAVAPAGKTAIQEWLNGEFAMTLGCPRRSAIAWQDFPEISSDLP